MKFIDSHAHLTDPAVFDEIDPILERACQQKIAAVVNICTDETSLEKGLALSKIYPWVYNAAATTPHDVEKKGVADFSLIEKLAKKSALVAIGETGLDYYYEHSPKEIQKKFLIKYLHLALDCELPVVIHCRDAFADLFAIIDAEYQFAAQHAPGVLHCFTGTLNEAKQVIARGWYLSLSGIVTFKKSTELREVAKWVPMQQLLIETDTPYLAPQSKRGKRNEPSFLIETAKMIAEVKQVSLEKIAETTKANAIDLFQLPK